MASSVSSSFLFFTCLSYFLLVWSSNKAYYCAYAANGEESNFHTLQSPQVISLLHHQSPHHVCKPSPKGHKKGGSLRVVHSHGPCSPHKAKFPSLTEILSQDQSRVNSIQTRVSFNSGLHDSRADLPARSGVPLGSQNYVVTVGLGTPKKDLTLTFDTGSDLTWTQCLPCSPLCYKQQEPKFDPSMSTTYRNITCNSAQCSQLVSATGFTPKCSASTCVYGTQYGDKSFSTGFFSTETLTITPTDVVSNFLFGCGQDNRGNFRGFAGLLGLGRDPVSIVSQTATRYERYFSYCLPSSPSSTGHLTFGKTSSPSLKFTPLLTRSGGVSASFYFISVTGIKVGSEMLPISQSVFAEGGMIIDSGTVITRLPSTAYAAMRASFRKQMEKYPLTQGQSLLDTCYDLSNYETVSIPKISFFFDGDVEVPMDFSGILIGEAASQLCLAFAVPNNGSNQGIFGNVQQRTLEVAYDVAGGKLGFGTAGCSRPKYALVCSL